jgi:CheY-like chemotaxis protein
MNEGVILLVEDDPSIAELAKLQLEQAELTNEVVLARDGLEALDLPIRERARSPPDAVSSAPGFAHAPDGRPRGAAQDTRRGAH